MGKETDQRKRVRRKYPRLPLTSTAKVLFGSKAMEVLVGNVSLGGVFFHSDHRFELGDTMSIAFSGTYQGVKFDECVQGRIITAYRSEERTSYGLQFVTELLSERYPSLTAFVDRGRRKATSFLRDPRYDRAERKS